MSKQSHATGTLPTNGYVRQSQLVPHIIPFSPATLWRKVKTGLFPRPVKLSERVTAWAVEDVRAWMQQQSPGVAKTVKRTQSRERTNTIVLSLNGVIRPLVAWAEDRGVNPSVMRRRKTLGWSDDEIIVGERKSTSDPTSTRLWAYTPWPKDSELDWELEYRRSRHSGEHRLTFYERFIIEYFHRLQGEFENRYVPDEEYTGMPSTPPTSAELKALNDIQIKMGRWQSLLRDARLKKILCAAENKPRFYDLPDWVEQKFDTLIQQVRKSKRRAK